MQLPEYDFLSVWSLAQSESVSMVRLQLEDMSWTCDSQGELVVDGGLEVAQEWLFLPEVGENSATK
eukprot:2498238-Pyramimonas_sp.AAC.1